MSPDPAAPGPMRRTGLRWFLRSLGRDWEAVAAFAGLLLVVLMAVFARHWSVADPAGMNLLSRLHPPFWVEGGSLAHPLGTDSLGRDLLSRILFGARVSLTIGFGAATLGGIIGILLGLYAGYFGGPIGNLLMRLADAQHAFPFIVIAIAVMAAVGPSFSTLLITLTIWSWVPFARMVRSQVLSVREMDFIDSARAMGASDLRIVMNHVLPATLPVIFVIWTLTVAQMIVAESSLSFLGVGIPPPEPSWGRSLSDGRAYIASAWWLVTFPGLAIMLTVLSINTIGDKLRDLFDPRGR